MSMPSNTDIEVRPLVPASLAPSVADVPRGSDVGGERALVTMHSPSPMETSIHQTSFSSSAAHEIHEMLASFREELSHDFRDWKSDLCTEIRLLLQGTRIPTEPLVAATGKGTENVVELPSSSALANRPVKEELSSSSISKSKFGWDTTQLSSRQVGNTWTHQRTNTRTATPRSAKLTSLQSFWSIGSTAQLGAFATAQVGAYSEYVKNQMTLVNATGHANEVKMFGSLSMFTKNDETDYGFHVHQLYHKSGFAQYVARSGFFNCSIMLMIFLNAIYMGIAAEYDDAGRLSDSNWKIQVPEHVFSSFFTLEIFIRFGAFARKWDCLKSKWFILDSLLVLHMLVENYVVGYLLPKNLTSNANLDVLRVVRLLRLARFTRLMRASSHMVTMVRAICAGTRAAASVMIMLIVLIYTFALVMHALLKEEPSMKLYFGNMLRSMWTLLLQGTFLDNISLLIGNLRDISAPISLGFFLCFVFLSAFVVINILLGILCEVVSKVAEAEEQSSASYHLRHAILGVVHVLDRNSDGCIDKDEFLELFQNPEAVASLLDLGIDIVYVEDMADALFTSEGKSVPIPEIMALLLKCRTERPCLMGDMLGAVKCQRFWMEQAHQKIAADIKKTIQIESARNSRALGGHHSASSSHDVAIRSKLNHTVQFNSCSGTNNLGGRCIKVL